MFQSFQHESNEEKIFMEGGDFYEHDFLAFSAL